MKLGAVYRTSILGAMLCSVNHFACVPLFGASTDVPVRASSEHAAETHTSQAGAADLLMRVREANEALFSNLQSFVCNEQIERFKGTLAGENPQHLDTLTTKVSFENGIEHYTDILQDKHPLTSISSVSGAWSEGEFGTLLEQTQILLATQRVFFRAYTDLAGTPAAIFGIEIAQQNSPWDLDVDHHHYRIPFHTEIWVSRATGQILKIERISTVIPSQAGISEIYWSVMLQAVQIDERTWLLPKTGNYSVLYRAAGRREWNSLLFSEYHRYGSEVALRFP